jgi:hypothetical protein
MLVIYHLFLPLHRFRSVAQLVEHMTLNHGVQGSIPCGPTDLGHSPDRVLKTPSEALLQQHFTHQSILKTGIRFQRNMPDPGYDAVSVIIVME